MVHDTVTDERVPEAVEARVRELRRLASLAEELVADSDD